MLDTALILAETRSLAIRAEHNVRVAVEADDVKTLTAQIEILDRVTDFARRQRKALQEPKIVNWALWCSWCGFSWGRHVGKKNVCPDCGERMKAWDLDMGPVPAGRRCAIP